MRHMILGLALGLIATTASAQTPPDVIEPYRAYIAALKEGDREAARKHIAKAYKAADKLMPDDHQTGALAENFADLVTDDTDEQLDLYRTALALLPADTEAERRVDLMSKIARAHMYRPFPLKDSHVRKAEKDIKVLREAIAAAGLQGSTFDAEALVIDAWTDNFFGRETQALDKIDDALAIFESPDHTVFSVLRYQARLIKGGILNNEDKPIEAALALQDVMQNLEGDLPADHPFIKRAFGMWVVARGEIEGKGMTDKALRDGVCKCWPYDEMSANSPVPLRRVPPAMPRTAKRSGRVLLNFDVGRDGKPKNIRATSGTDKMFIKPSIRAVEGWTYEVVPEHTDEDLSGLAATITFRLTSGNGKLLPEDELEIWEAPDDEEG